MKTGPDIALIGSLVGDPARANMLTALMGGKALTASELALEAGVTSPTASSHLGKLAHGGLVVQRKQGRHRYYALSGEDVAEMLEQIMGLAARAGHLRVRTGPKDPAMRYARVCYDHLAGDRAVALFDGLRDRGYVEADGEQANLTRSGSAFLADWGVDLAPYAKSRRPMCKPCLDWSNRRSHMAGALGAALLKHFIGRSWVTRHPGSRTVTITPKGEAAFDKMFGGADMV